MAPLQLAAAPIALTIAIAIMPFGEPLWEAISRTLTKLAEGCGVEIEHKLRGAQCEARHEDETGQFS